MKHLLITLVGALMCLTNALAQTLSTDATLVAKDGNVITLRASATADKKKMQHCSLQNRLSTRCFTLELKELKTVHHSLQ